MSNMTRPTYKWRALRAALVAACALMAGAGSPGPFTPAGAAAQGPGPAPACEGSACAQVALSFDDARQQYRAQNNSDRAVVVEGENLVAAARVRVAAGRAEYLPLKSLAGAYRANYE